MTEIKKRKIPKGILVIADGAWVSKPLIKKLKLDPKEVAQWSHDHFIQQITGKHQNDA